MLSLLNVEQSGYGTLKLDLPVPGGVAPPQDAAPCRTCAAYRTAPELDGNLRVDPEIVLPSPGLDVEIAYYSNANQPYNGPFGYGRTLSTSLIAQAEAVTTPTWVSMTRGNGAVVSYAYDSTIFFFYYT